jgi:hypothetical protein
VPGLASKRMEAELHRLRCKAEHYRAIASTAEDHFLRTELLRLAAEFDREAAIIIEQGAASAMNSAPAA